MKNAAASRLLTPAAVRSATRLAARTKERPVKRHPQDAEGIDAAHIITPCIEICKRCLSLLFLLACLLFASQAQAADSCMPGSTLCENNTIKICDLNSGIVELKCPENTFCKADTHGARCQPRKKKDASDRTDDNDDDSTNTSNEIRRQAENDEAGHDECNYSSRRRVANECTVDNSGDNYVLKSPRRVRNSSNMRRECSEDQDGGEQCVSGTNEKRSSASSKENRLAAQNGLGGREEQRGERKSSAGHRKSLQELSGKKSRNRKEKGSGSLLSEEEALDISDSKQKPHLEAKGLDAYEGSGGTNRMSSFHETAGAFGMSSNTSAASSPSEILAHRQMMAAEGKAAEEEGGVGATESMHEHSPGITHSILSKRDSSGTKNQKVIVLTVTKSMKSPPIEMHMEYTMPGSVTPVVKKFSSKDGETFTEAPSSDKSSSVTSPSPNPSGAEPKQGLMASTMESQKSAQGLSSSGSSTPASPSSGPGGASSPGTAATSKDTSGSASSAPPSSGSAAKTQPSGPTGTSSPPSAPSSPASKSPLADATPSANASSPAKTPQSSAGSPSSASSSSGGGGGGGKTISKEDLTAIMKEFSFNPNPEYVDIVLKGVEEKEKDEDLVPMFLAQLAHESGGFEHIEEIACKQTGCPGQYGTGAPGKSYHGRGFIQLSWPDNYKKAGAALGMGDKLYEDPDQVAKDPKLAFDVSWWYWDQVVRPALGGKKDFGATTKAINGALECGGGGNEKAQKRYKIYEAICKKMGKTPAPDTGC